MSIKFKLTIYVLIGVLAISLAAGAVEPDEPVQIHAMGPLTKIVAYASSTSTAATPANGGVLWISGNGPRK